MNGYQSILARLEQEEAERWHTLCIAIEEAQSYDNEDEWAELDCQLRLYQMARRLLFESRVLCQGTQPIALLEASKEA